VCLGAILRQLGQYTEAEACLRSSLAFHKQQNEREYAGWALYELAMLLREEGNFREAASMPRRRWRSPRGWLCCGRGLDAACDGRGEPGLWRLLRGPGAFELALGNFRTLHDHEGCAATLRDRGTVYEALANTPKPSTTTRRPCASSTTWAAHGPGWVLADRSVVYTDQGKLDLAEKACMTP